MQEAAVAEAETVLENEYSALLGININEDVDASPEEDQQQPSLGTAQIIFEDVDDLWFFPRFSDLFFCVTPF